MDDVATKLGVPRPTRYVEMAYVAGLKDEALAGYLKGNGLGWIVELRALVESLEPVRLRRRPWPVGRKPYHPLSLLGLCVYGLLQEVRCPRALRDLAVRDVGAWYMGRGIRPSTEKLRQFLKQTQLVMPGEFFTESNARLRMRVAELLGEKLLAGGCHMDGSVVEAAASRHTTMRLGKVLALQQELQTRMEEHYTPAAEALFFEGEKSGAVAGAPDRGLPAGPRRRVAGEHRTL